MLAEQQTALTNEVPSYSEFSLPAGFNFKQFVSVNGSKPLIIASDVRHGNSLQSLELLVTLQILDQASKSSISQSEVQQLATLRHPHLLQLFEYIPDPYSPAVSMEKVDGLLLSDWLEMRVLGNAELCALVTQLLDVATFLWQQGFALIIDPQRCVVSEKGVVKCNPLDAVQVESKQSDILQTKVLDSLRHVLSLALTSYQMRPIGFLHSWIERNLGIPSHFDPQLNAIGNSVLFIKSHLKFEDWLKIMTLLRTRYVGSLQSAEVLRNADSYPISAEKLKTSLFMSFCYGFMAVALIFLMVYGKDICNYLQ